MIWQISAGLCRSSCILLTSPEPSLQAIDTSQPACVAGAVSHETQQFILLVVDTINIILFKSRDTAHPLLEP